MLSLKRSYKIIIIVGVLLLSGIAVSFGLEDGFGPSKRIEGKYFVVYYAAQIDISELIQQLNVTLTDKLLTGEYRGIKEKPSPETELAEMLDVLFMRVSDILDMHVYSFQGNVKICSNQQEMSSIYNKLFGTELPSSVYSFYINDTSTIYISAENFSRWILGHEISHAIINHYFVVQTPIRVQEILSKYVEYQLRKE